jgi:hypothetical protein
MYDAASISQRSGAYRWIRENENRVLQWDSVIKGRLTWTKFFSNIKFAVSSLISRGDQY